MRTLSGFLIGLLFFMSVFIGMGALLSELSTTYSVPVNDSFVNTYNRIDEITGQADTIKDQVTGSEVDVESQAWASKGILSAIKLPFSMVGMAGDFMNDIVDELHFPHWVIGVIFSGAIVIPLVFIVISALARREM